jgi:hypothetical protein
MKILQTRILKSLLIGVCLSIYIVPARAQGKFSLKTADSLFKTKQYTQSFDLYHSLFQQKKYSPAMLLKMAYIQEGLGHISQSLYYMNLYYQTTHDEEVLTKIEEVANHYGLDGYTTTPTAKLLAFLEEHFERIAAGLISIIILLFGLAIFQRRRSKSIFAPVFFEVIFALLLIAHVNFAATPQKGIITQAPAYLMSGPSSGSSVTAIISEGNQLDLLGKEDVWLKMLWGEKEVYVKASAVLPVRF